MLGARPMLGARCSWGHRDDSTPDRALSEFSEPDPDTENHNRTGAEPGQGDSRVVQLASHPNYRASGVNVE